MANITIEISKGFGRMFYIVSPSETSFEHFENVPDYTFMAAYYFWALIAIEFVVIVATGKSHQMSINDSITSIGAGMLMEVVRFLSRGAEFKVYLYIYEYHRLYTLPWDNPLTWLIAVLGVDLGYYWVHRMCHEVNIMWAAHQMHHSSEYYNLTTALRQSVAQFVFAWPFYLPLAFFLPPSHYLVHAHLNLIYQFWIHAGPVPSLGPIEYIINTPSHHRVHHGCNRYCIDKNYAGFLIIWDRMFGTFEPEGEDIAYGLTHAVNSFNPLWTQIHHFSHIWNQFWNIEGFGNKLKTIFYGPGWSPGKPRLGLTEDLPDHKPPIPQYNPKVTVWCRIYCFIHFLIVIFAFLNLPAQSKDPFGPVSLAIMTFVIFSTTSLGALFDKLSWGPLIESGRCLIVFLAIRMFSPVQYIQPLFFASSLFWIVYYVRNERIFQKKLE